MAPSKVTHEPGAEERKKPSQLREWHVQRSWGLWLEGSLWGCVVGDEACRGGNDFGSALRGWVPVAQCASRRKELEG